MPEKLVGALGTFVVAVELRWGIEGANGADDGLLPSPSQKFVGPNWASYWRFCSCALLVFSACSLSCCSCKVSLLLGLFDPKETRFENESVVVAFGMGVVDLGVPDANGKGVERPDEAVEVGRRVVK
jgi:hypothetical protein